MQPDLIAKIADFFKKKGSVSLSQHRVMLVCMGLSLLVWFFVKMTQTYESRGVLAMNYRTPMGRVFAEPPLRTMPFKFSGTGWRLLSMGIFNRRPSLDFNLSNAPLQVISRTDISLKIEDELRLNLLELGQDNITVRLDSLFSKKVAIKLDTAINFQNGYFFRDVATLTPDSVMVFGAAQMLDGFTEISTEPLEMDCPETDFRKSLKLINPNPTLLQFSAMKTELFMPVEQFTEKKLVLPVLVLNASDSIRLIPASVELSCVVGVSRYHEVNASDFRLVAVFGGESGPSGTASMVPLSLVRQPPWVRSVRLLPKAVEYLIVE